MNKVIKLFIILLITISAAAQNQSVVVDAAEQKLVIDSVSKLLNDNYVFPEVAQKMTQLLQENYKKGTYTSITSAPGFAQQLTKDLQSVSNDKHLNVNFNPKMIQQIRAGNQGPPPEFDNQKMNNYGFKEVKLLDGNIGYLDLRGFAQTNNAGETAVAAMNFLSNASALIIDLRNNGGGSPSMIQLLTSYFYGPEPVHLNSFYHRPANETTETWTLTQVAGKRRPDIDIYVLTSKKTFSAAEEFTYNLKNLKRAIIIGETTGGGAHPGGTRIATERFTVWVPTGRAINPLTKTNWEGTGVKPDIETKASDALAVAHVKALETLVAKSKGMLKNKYEWELVSLQQKKEPAQLDKATMGSYAGEFGEKKLVLEDEQLYFFPFPGTKVKLTPLQNDLFQLENMNNVRLRILKENTTVLGIEELFANGNSEKHLKRVL